MTKITPEELLKDKEVVAEINRHLWIESERAGFDVGFEKAAEDWMRRFSAEWIRHNYPNTSSRSNNAPKRKSRSAKSYIQTTR